MTDSPSSLRITSQLKPTSNDSYNEKNGNKSGGTAKEAHICKLPLKRNIGKERFQRQRRNLSV